jgi:hypothetical protein
MLEMNKALQFARSFLDDPVSLKARRQGRREGIQWHEVHLMQEIRNVEHHQ